MTDFIIKANEFLQKKITAFYHIDYVGMGKPGNPDYVNHLKNTYDKSPKAKLNSAVQDLEKVLEEDLPQILEILDIEELTVCVVPRSKAENNFSVNQLLFRSTICNVVNRLDGFNNGTNYIIRHTNTKTTHLPENTPNYNNDGESPYPGITDDTCDISESVKGQDILLIDDIYTRGVNIDEDTIQTLLDKGAKSVYFYAIGRTGQAEFIF